MLQVGAQRLAAKFRTNSEGAPVYHPLACHMADVAAVALALWDECLSIEMRRELSAGLGLAEEGEARQWVAFLAGLHDLGKASRPFQKKDPNHRQRLAGSGLDAATNFDDPGHGVVTAAQLPTLLEGQGVDRRLAHRLATVLGGHHGVFPLLSRGQGKGERDDIGEERPEVRARWEAARQQLFAELKAVLELGPVPTGQLPNPAVMLLGGFVTISDWIGSIDDEGFFTYQPDGAANLSAYFSHARERAEKVLKTLQWTAYLAPKRRTFEEAFSRTPYPLQRRVDALRKDNQTPPFVVIEAPMGEGKTEAALHLLEGWTADGMARGFYVALPTQATANQMYDRVKGFLTQAFAAQLGAGDEVNLVLAHGGAWLRDDVEYLPSGVYDEGAPRAGSVAAGEWFLGRKRTLLAPYGVGTVDQALMAVLQVRHVFVRLYGLAGKAVVIDEVHAYDTYMTGLLERLLEWLGALGSPVVLLSATLPTGRRQLLAEVYRKGRGDGATQAHSAPAAYPRITWLEGGDIRSESLAAAERSVRKLKLEKIADSAEAVRELLIKELRDGGCAVVICNTVRRAQETYLALTASFAADQLLLFHAQFLANDRQRIEKECRRMFGPPGSDGVERPNRFVLVATQVVEQSLDVDFDVMVTDLAPVDLLLQRSGRLQRHDRPERTVRDSVLHVRWPEELPDSAPEFDPASTYVYDEHILLRTWHALRDRGAIAIPEDIQGLVDLVYAEEEALPGGASEPLADKWRATWEAMRRNQTKELSIAKQPLIPDPWFIDEEFFDAFGPELLEDRPDVAPSRKARTRYQELPSIGIVWLRADELDRTDIDQKPSAKRKEQVRWLLERSATLSGHWTKEVALGSSAPPSWTGHPALMNTRLVVSDQGIVHVPEGPSLVLDPELGICVTFVDRSREVVID